MLASFPGVRLIRLPQLESHNDSAPFRSHDQLCVVKWRQHLFLPLQPKLTRALLELIKRDREGQSIYTSLVSDVIDCFFLLGEGLTDGRTTYV